MGTWGGAQKNAGRKPGGHNKETLQRLAVEKQLHQNIMQKANRLLKVMMMQAEGEIFLFRVDISETEKGNKRKEHNMVTDWREIKSFFNEHTQDIDTQDELTGLSGKVKDKYYYIKTAPSDWRAADALFDRAFGKSTQHISNDDGDNEKDNYEQLNGEQLDRHIGDLRVRIEKIKQAKGEANQITDNKGVTKQITEEQKK